MDMAVLVVEDDEIVRTIVAAALTKEGARVMAVTTAGDALTAAKSATFGLMIVDVNLPDTVGFDLVAQVRRQQDCPVLFLTTRGDVKDRVRGLDAGADDYLVKPIDLDELNARIRAVLRRSLKVPELARLIALPGWTLDLVRRELATADGYLVKLTRAEFDLLSALVHASPTALDRDYLLEVISSVETRAGERTIDVLISRIRTKLEAAPASALKIVTVRGGGYRFETPR